MTRIPVVVFLLIGGLTAAVFSQQLPPRDPPAPQMAMQRLITEFQGRIASESLTVKQVLELAVKAEQANGDRAEAVLLAARNVFPSDVLVLRALGGYYNRAGNFPQTMAMLEEAAALQPNDPNGFYTVATYYEEKVRKDFRVPEADRLTYVLKGLEATDRALALNPDYGEALVYKNILLRHQMRLEPDRGRQQLLEQQADQLRNRAIELRKQQSPIAPVAGATYAPPPPPPPPPPAPPRPPCVPASSLLAQAPVRVGGNIKAPAKVRDVRPVYPDLAQSTKIQGVVIIEATIAEDGRVVGACVLRSIPLLDDAAVEAVNQWEFTPTLLNGVAVPVVMTVTVNFVLQ